MEGSGEERRGEEKRGQERVRGALWLLSAAEESEGVALVGWAQLSRG